MFRQDPESMATTFDYDYENDIANHKENFTGPLHTTDRVYKIMIREIWQGD